MALDTQLAKCDVALIVIGPNWRDHDAGKSRRIDTANDSDAIRRGIAEVNGEHRRIADCRSS